MSELGLIARKKRAFKPKTTINNPMAIKSERIFKIEHDKPSRPNEVWASDLTYIPTDGGFCYLVVIMDLFNREIKGWDLSDSMEAKNTKNALTKAVQKCPGTLEKTIFHSDQGIQYCSSLIRNRLGLLKMTQSMSRKGNCYDNAYAESFFSTLKTELAEMKFRNADDARKSVSDYIENWYNTKRMHSSLGYLSPVEYVQLNRHVA